MGLDGLISEAGFAGELRYAEPMARHTSLGIGGPAGVMAFPETVSDLAKLAGAAYKTGEEVFYLGKGSNILVGDGGIPGLVINMGRLSWIDMEREGTGPVQVHAGAGVTLARLVRFTIEAGLSGLEFVAGIPGTLGGAVAMNAGAGEYEMKDVLTRVTLMDKRGGLVTIPASGLNMGYRTCGFPEDGMVVAEAAVGLVPWPREEVKQLVAKNVRRRRNTQPLAQRSAGSTFKNPPGYSAWRLIEMAGLKGRMVGGAQVSMKHSNFLINTGGATAREFKSLMDLVVETVKEKLNITLEPEIKVVGVEI